MALQEVIRPEEEGDGPAVHRLLVSAFPTDGEARLVDALRQTQRLFVSLVAVRDADIVGHIAFSPVTIDGHDVRGLGLAPVAVSEKCRGCGIGSRLIREGIQNCQQLGFRFLVVLGTPEFYGRFGFVPAASRGLDNEYQAGDAFMVLELDAGCLNDTTGLVRYAPEFQTLADDGEADVTPDRIQPGCYAVIFQSQRTGTEPEEYQAMAARMADLASQQRGFLGMESVRDASGTGMTVSYWSDREAIDAWKQNAEHQVAQRLGRDRWYQSFRLQVCRVEQHHEFDAVADADTAADADSVNG